MGQRDFAAIAALVGMMSLGLSGCFAARVVRTDTLVSYELIRAPEAPPPIPEGTVLTAPSAAPAGVTWMEPYWMWNGGQYTWMVGRWIPTLVGYGFLQPRWHETRDGWAMTGGAWTDPEGTVIATPPPSPGATVGVRPRCDETTTTTVAYEPAPPTTTQPIDPPPAPRHRIDRTVTLGHRSYAPLRSDDDDDASERADASWVTTAGAGDHATTTTSTSSTSTSYASAPPIVVYRAPVRTGTSYTTSAPSASSTGGTTSWAARTGYAGSSGSSTSSSGGGSSWGARTGYSGRSSSSGGSPTRAP